ncbi:MAG: cardiolipin synthase [Oscillospiraceae bacterium]|nr:cardiolipin synthase [Oscillospiraceae bacterium]
MKSIKQALFDEDELLERLITKGKQGLIRTIFGRTAIVTALLLVQIFLTFGFYRYLERIFPLYFGSMTLVVLGMMIHLINARGNPAVKLTWAALIAVAPVAGTLFYFYIRTDLGYLRQEKNLRSIEEAARRFVLPQTDLMNRLAEEDKPLYRLASYLTKTSGAPVFEHTEVTYYSLGDHMFRGMIEQIKQAERFVFLEYFAIAKGELWTELLTLLTKKAKEGVEVRLLYDGTCAFVALPYRYPQALEALGIRCKVFSPIHPVVTTRYNNRDHRKICVIDGHTAFTGGLNLEDPYINREMRYGHWKDAGIMLHGDGARTFTQLFLQMWNSEDPEQIYEPYLLEPGSCGLSVPGYVIGYGDSPLDEELVGEMVYLDIINRANDYVYIMTPYLILDHEMITALTYAAKRGVDVRLILPHIPDKEYAFALAKTHYRELMEAGITIYEYTPGFIHSKVFLSDDHRAVVGTINLDYRSLYLHFECAAYLQDVPALSDIRKDFDETFLQSQIISPEDLKRDKLSRRLLGRLLKVLAPLM